MKSFDFPKMFNTNSTRTISDKEATKRNLESLLHCEKGEFLSDPYYGIRLKRYMFEQNSSVLKDIIVDEIYTQIALFMPQLKVTRKDITITQSKATLYAKIKCVNRVDFTTDLYNIVIFQEGDQ